MVCRESVFWTFGQFSRDSCPRRRRAVSGISVRSAPDSCHPWHLRELSAINQTTERSRSRRSVAPPNDETTSRRAAMTFMMISSLHAARPSGCLPAAFQSRIPDAPTKGVAGQLAAGRLFPIPTSRRLTYLFSHDINVYHSCRVRKCVKYVHVPLTSSPSFSKTQDCPPRRGII